MNWKDPRHELPQDEQVIWIWLEEATYYDCDKNVLPHATVKLAQVTNKNDGFTCYAEEINYKGHLIGFPHNFYMYDIERDTVYSGNYPEPVKAWALWDNEYWPGKIRSKEECEEFYKNHPFYPRFLMDMKIKEKDREQPFISIYDAYPKDKQMCVAVSKEKVWILTYDPSKDNHWVDPMGNAIKAWLPLPQYYTSGQ